jgi:Tfp pilus assembly protein PilW
MLSGKTNNHRRIRAFTFPELVLAIAIASLVSVALGTTLIYSVRSVTGLHNYVALDRDGRRALDSLTADVRSCRGVSAASPSGTYTNLTSVTFTSREYTDLTYEFGSNTLTRTENGSTTMLMTNCVGFFNLYQPGLQPNSWTQYTNAQTLGDCKVVMVRWTANRSFLRNTNNSGGITNTEDIVTAKVLMRNNL